MIILVDVDQFLLITRISAQNGTDTLGIYYLSSYKFVPRELFNMVQIKYIYFNTHRSELS